MKESKALDTNMAKINAFVQNPFVHAMLKSPVFIADGITSSEDLFESFKDFIVNEIFQLQSVSKALQQTPEFKGSYMEVKQVEHEILSIIDLSKSNIVAALVSARLL